jgi:hypothetical protein
MMWKSKFDALVSDGLLARSGAEGCMATIQHTQLLPDPMFCT